MIRALSPTEGFEASAHTFQAVESEGRWKSKEDYGPGRELMPPEKKRGNVKIRTKTILKISITSPSEAMRDQITYSAYLNTSGIVTLGFYAEILAHLPAWTVNPSEAITFSHLPNPTHLKVIPRRNKRNRELPLIKQAIQAVPSVAEIEAVWWSDGLEIYAGHVAPRHVCGFGSLFNNQARVEFNGTTFGNAFPLSYLLTFTGHLNPVGPKFFEFRRATIITADGKAIGQYCELSDRDDVKGRPQTIKPSAKDGYVLEVPSLTRPQ